MSVKSVLDLSRELRTEQLVLRDPPHVHLLAERAVMEAIEKLEDDERGRVAAWALERWGKP